MRRVVSVIGSGLLTFAVLTAPTAGSAASAAPADRAGESAAATVAAKKKAGPVRPGKACRKRLAKPKKVVPSKRFAKCVTKGMLNGRTAFLSSTYDDGQWTRGDGRFKKKYTEASARYSDGSKLVVLGGKAWWKPAGSGWVRARKGGTPNEQLAWNIQQLWVGLSSAPAYRSYLRASTTGWTPTGVHRKVNGVKAREYVGTVVMDGATFDDYRVWVDRWDRPIRITSTLTLMGITSTGVQDFKKWGKKVAIKKPIN